MDRDPAPLPPRSVLPTHEAAVARAAIAGLGSLGEGGRAAVAGLTRSGGIVACDL